jgi:site-specific DNA-methyltransferase (adenine-specific)
VKADATLAIWPDTSVDLVNLDILRRDPPFNSNRDYNVIFRDESGNASDAQLLAFEDTWTGAY